ncbi:hypothetical protein LUZ63_015912 [Rhynchospora breviuscula]|uniref:Uncharacterized protein n=1 Tax=Rhynchospora breviuscula TaxID=2022672 RepID=A0A9Q0CD65_9POAL|nr:hypothetical protein LUZ63_015912 [Rhynchospora breviuscula]
MAKPSMDYELAALKLFSAQLRGAKQEPHVNALCLFGIRFQRAWLQGVLVSGSDEGPFLLDDGSDVVELTVPPLLAQSQWKAGQYVMVVGPYTPSKSGDEFPSVLAQKMVDLSSHPDRESMWYLEVVEAHKLFYLNNLT